MSAPVTTAVLVAAVVATAIAVVFTKHEARKAFIELQALEQKRDALDIEWGRLQLEHSAWSEHGRIERLARERLQMHLPEHKNVVLVAPQ